ncbi:MAG: GNAT family N-acetyltransferase [Saprospiraceae bacterium]|nr:GNAT family N-acetyltransferase [Saprospiraceae bacterium]
MNMALHIRPFINTDLAVLVQLSLLAWEPVFSAWQQILGAQLYPIAIYPDWRKSQKDVVEKICQDEKMTTWVAEVDGEVVGFVVYELNHDRKIGEVQLLAVHPDAQNHGIGTELNIFALQKLKENGMKLAVVGTGGDDGHAPARRSYEKAGYTGLPLVRYYKEL